MWRKVIQVENNPALSFSMSTLCLLCTQICNLPPFCSYSSTENIPVHYRVLARKSSCY